MPAGGGDMGSLWSQMVIDRPFVVAKGKIGAEGDLDIIHLSTPGVMGMPGSSSTAEALSIGGAYGVSDKINAGLTYTFALHSFEIKGPLALFGTYQIMHKDKMTLAASASLNLNLNGHDAMGGSQVDVGLGVGVGFRYNVAPKIAVFTGGGTLPGFGKIAFASPFGPLAGSPAGQQLSFGFNSGGPISLDLPVGVGFQATPQIYVALSTAIAHIKIANDSNSLIFADYIPLSLGAMYNVNKNIDAGLTIDLPDLKGPGFDLLFIGLGARYYN